MKELFRYGFILALICIAAAGLLSGMNLLTRDRILAQAQTEELAGLKDVMPQADSFKPINEKGEIVYYTAKDAHKKTIGFVFKTTAQGYAGKIQTLAGLTPDGTITGIKVLDQNETPGLGGRICEVKESKKSPWFQEQFTDKKVEDLNSVQAITGATISSRAVIDSVKKRAEEILKIANERR